MKIDVTSRFCVHHRKPIDKYLIRDPWPIPEIETRVSAVGGVRYVSVFDVQSVYYRIPGKESHIFDSERQIHFQMASIWRCQRPMVFSLALWTQRSRIRST